MNCWPRPLSFCLSISPPFSSLLSCVMENIANESCHCTVQYVYMYNCPVPVPGVENIVIFLVSSWVRGERLLTSSKMGKARTVFIFFSQQSVPNFWSTLFRGTTNTLNCTQFAEIGRKEDNWGTKQNGREFALNVSCMFFLFKKNGWFSSSQYYTVVCTAYHCPIVSYTAQLALALIS